jgi:hypothetical protein
MFANFICMKRFSGLMITCLLLLACSHSRLLAQDSLKVRLKTDANQLFIKKDYTKALPLYQELLRFYPKEPEYQYRTGVCLLSLNSNIEEVIRLMRSVSATDYNPMAWYYLGRALHLSYAFEDAIKAYSKFVLLGNRSDITALGVERLIEMAKNGMEYTRSASSIKVQNSQTLTLEQLQVSAQINGTGKLMKKPEEFCTKTDLRKDYHPWMFLPAYTEVNEYVYVTGFEKREKNGKQLYRVKNINHQIWGKPELLDQTINTLFDEEFPFFDSRTSTLYFSSKGHSSMGGYDIFKSVYNWNTKTWSEPENLGFPINSPYDDFVFVTDDFGRTASFVSNRGSGPGQVTAYRIVLAQDSTGIRLAGIDDIRKASLMNPEAAKPESAIAPEKEEDLKNGSVADIVMSSIPIESVQKAGYQDVLSEALHLQIRADSLSRAARDMRIAAKDVTEDATKKQMVSKILKTEKEAKRLQREADLKFAEARNLKTGNDTLKEASAEVVDEAVIEVAKPQAEVKAPASTAVADDFILMEKSPYSESNPIPNGLNTCPGLVYRIQLGVFSKVKPFDAFGGITPVAYEQAGGGNVLKYYAGLFYSLNSVSAALEKIRTKGFTDAFIVAFLDGKPIPTEKAREIEFSGYKL